jgi:3-methyladenine DNA glycosylase AlkD
MDKTIALEFEISSSLNSLPSLTTDAVRTLRRGFSKRLAEARADFVVSLALQLLKSDKRIPRFFSYELVQHHPDAMRSLNSRKVELLGEGIDSWFAVDAFACYLAGPAWREGQVPDTLITRWARSTNRWWRRAAVVSTVPLNNKARGGQGDAARTLQICQLVVHDRDDMVIKALSWALRELSKRDSKTVKTFLNKNQPTLASRVVREVNNKLKTGLKNPTKL